jgi:hypothetical protein
MIRTEVDLDEGTQPVKAPVNLFEEDDGWRPLVQRVKDILPFSFPTCRCT